MKDYKFTLENLPEIMDRKISIGEIVSVSHSFQNIDEINKFYSDMLGVNFVKEIKKVEVEPEKSDPYVLKDKYPDFWRKVEELTRLRHSIYTMVSSEGN